MLTVVFESIRGGRRREAVFDLGSDEANALCAVTVAWKINSRIVSSASLASQEDR